ncbi:restriction endonuclease [Streptomyces sp. BpilaLS-43]|uniref:restriction endonuclease n=1 Tax=Streptomyces sp. BpilaLS-43 TaxID=1839778 RepID=UPI00351F74EA
MRYWGYRDARAEPGGADGGIDVWSARALGQVKYQAAAVGRPDLQRLFGARGRMLDRHLFFFTGSSYAAPAVAYALENDIALFVYGLDGSMEARNAPARRAVEAARRAGATSEPEPVRSPPPTTPAPAARPHAMAADPPKKRHPGTSRLLLGLFLAAVAVFLPGSESFSPQPDRLLGNGGAARHPLLPAGMGRRHPIVPALLAHGAEPLPVGPSRGVGGQRTTMAGRRLRSAPPDGPGRAVCGDGGPVDAVGRAAAEQRLRDRPASPIRKPPVKWAEPQLGPLGPAVRTPAAQARSSRVPPSPPRGERLRHTRSSPPGCRTT